MKLNDFLQKYKAIVKLDVNNTPIGGKRRVTIRTTLPVDFEDMRSVPQINVHDRIPTVFALGLTLRDHTPLKNKTIVYWYSGCVIEHLEQHFEEKWIQMEFYVDDVLSYQPHQQQIHVDYVEANRRKTA